MNSIFILLHFAASFVHKCRTGETYARNQLMKHVATMLSKHSRLAYYFLIYYFIYFITKIFRQFPITINILLDWEMFVCLVVIYVSKYFDN